MVLLVGLSPMSNFKVMLFRMQKEYKDRGIEVTPTQGNAILNNFL